MQQQTGYLELAEAFLKAGADVNARLAKSLWYTTYNRDLLGVDRTGATAFWLAAYTLDIPAMKLLLQYGADPNIRTAKVPERYEEGGPDPDAPDKSGLPPVPWGGPAVAPIHAASGVGYGLGFAGNTHRHVPDGWVPAVKFLVEELGADVNARDHNGYTPIHHAASRGDNELIRYLVSKGADPKALARTGQSTVDLANGPVQRIQPYPGDDRAAREPGRGEPSPLRQLLGSRPAPSPDRTGNRVPARAGRLRLRLRSQVFACGPDCVYNRRRRGSFRGGFHASTVLSASSGQSSRSPSRPRSRSPRRLKIRGSVPGGSTSRRPP